MLKWEGGVGWWWWGSGDKGWGGPGPKCWSLSSRKGGR